MRATEPCRVHMRPRSRSSFCSKERKDVTCVNITREDHMWYSTGVEFPTAWWRWPG